MYTISQPSFNRVYCLRSRLQQRRTNAKENKKTLNPDATRHATEEKGKKHRNLCLSVKWWVSALQSDNKQILLSSFLSTERSGWRMIPWTQPERKADQIKLDVYQLIHKRETLWSFEGGRGDCNIFPRIFFCVARSMPELNIHLKLHLTRDTLCITFERSWMIWSCVCIQPVANMVSQQSITCVIWLKAVERAGQRHTRDDWHA